MPMSRKVVMFYPYVSPRAAQAVVEILNSRWIGQGTVVAEFEKSFCERLGLRHVVAVNSVAAAIRLALVLAGVGPGDEVITSAQTCSATNFPILEQFAAPVFADIQFVTGNIDAGDIPKRITEKTKAIICSHWGGYPCDMDEIQALAKKHDLAVIEDASDAIGASYKGRPLGDLSPFTCFSFRAVQQITAAEGGMLCLLSEKDFESARRRRWFGIDKVHRKPNQVGYFDFDIHETGFGYHMTNVHAAIGLANLEELPALLQRRGQIADNYTQALEKMPGISLLDRKADRVNAHALFTIHVEQREEFCRALRCRGVETSIVHDRNDRYTVFGGLRKDLANLDRFSRSHISLPLHNQLVDEDVDHVIRSIQEGW
jgi:perosamine synthetase